MQKKMNSLRVNASLNAIKQVCGIVFPIISFSYASRVVGAEGIGVYSFAQSIISYMLLIASIGVTNYAIREGAKIKDDSNTLNDFCNEVFSINLTFTALSYIVLIVLMLSWTRLHEYRYAILIQSTAIIITTIGADWVNTIFEDYRYLTIRYIVIQFIALISMVFFVKSPKNLYVYIVICTLSSVGGNLLNIIYIRRYVHLRFTLKMNFSKHIIPLLILFFNSVASVIYLNSDITMLRIFTNDKEVGIYTVSTKVYSVLKTLINGVTYVTVPRFSYYLGKGLKEDYSKHFYKLFDALIIITFPAAVGMFMLSGNILQIFAGHGYESGASVIQILSIAFPFAVGSCLFSYAVLIPNSFEKYFMVSTIIAAATNIVLNIILIPVMGMNGAALTTLLAEIIVYIISSHYSNKCIQRKIQWRKYGSVLIGSALVLITCYLISFIQLSEIWTVVFSVVGSCVVYLAVMLVCKVPEINEIIQIIQKRFRISK